MVNIRVVSTDPLQRTKRGQEGFPASKDLWGTCQAPISLFSLVSRYAGEPGIPQGMRRAARSMCAVPGHRVVAPSWQGETWVSVRAGGGSMVGLDDLKGCFQPKRFHDCMRQQLASGNEGTGLVSGPWLQSQWLCTEPGSGRRGLPWQSDVLRRGHPFPEVMPPDSSGDYFGPCSYQGYCGCTDCC